jgi:hypothetical protein
MEITHPFKFISLYIQVAVDLVYFSAEYLGLSVLQEGDYSFRAFCISVPILVLTTIFNLYFEIHYQPKIDLLGNSIEALTIQIWLYAILPLILFLFNPIFFLIVLALIMFYIYCLDRAFKKLLTNFSPHLSDLVRPRKIQKVD